MKSKIDYRIQNLAFDGATLFFSTAKTVYFIPNPLNVLNEGAIELNRLNVELNSINDIYCQDSTLYIASEGGLTFIPIQDVVKKEPSAPKPYIKSVLMDAENIDFLNRKIELPGNKRLSIEFASLNFSSSPSEFIYMLEGIDEQWIEGDETKVVYLNLPPGNYTFKVKARKISEEYSESVELPIRVRPTFFQLLMVRIGIFLIFGLFVFLVIKWVFKRKIRQKETESLMISLEHKALQSMMNPHFIFNALGSIQRYLLENKAGEAGTYLSQFARLIRQNMNSLKSNSICIDDEVERLRNYIELERFRMNNNFEYEIDVDENLDEFEICIPSMIVQPFVENAIWHGVSSLNGGGKIAVKFKSVDEKSLVILIEDNGIGIQKAKAFSKSEQNLNMGVSITGKRLTLIGEQYHVKTGIVAEELNPENKNPGTQIKLIVPILT